MTSASRSYAPPSGRQTSLLKLHADEFLPSLLPAATIAANSTEGRKMRLQHLKFVRIGHIPSQRRAFQRARLGSWERLLDGNEQLERALQHLNNTPGTVLMQGGIAS